VVEKHKGRGDKDRLENTANFKQYSNYKINELSGYKNANTVTRNKSM